MRKFTVLALALALLLLGAIALPAYAATVTFQANLSGSEEVPGPGDPDGYGYAYFTIDTANNTICYRLYADLIAPATAAHIHRGARGVAGPVVVGLMPPGAYNQSVGCTTASASLINEIVSNPAGFYVNVHNAQYPAGAIRGQLRPASAP